MNSKYIYIDLGAYSGDSYLNFLGARKLPTKPKYFEAYLVEPNPNFKESLLMMKEQFPQIKQVITKAAWVEDGEALMAIDTNRRAYGSTLMESKKEIWDNFEKITVKTFDFSKWIKKFKGNYVIVKCDIEGAEFKLLPKMINDGTHKIIKQLWIETHPNKVRDYTTDASNALIKRLRQDIYVEEWT